MSETRLSHPIDTEYDARIRAFWGKIKHIKETGADLSYSELVTLAENSPWLWNLPKGKDFTFWDRIGAASGILFYARQGNLIDGVFRIQAKQSTIIIEIASDPHYYEALKTFCSLALRNAEVPHSDGQRFKLDDALLNWFGAVSGGIIKKPRKRKNQIARHERRDEAIARTVRDLILLGLPIYKNDSTHTVHNCCDVVAAAINRTSDYDNLDGERVKRIYYKSEWPDCDNGFQFAHVG